MRPALPRIALALLTLFALAACQVEGGPPGGGGAPQQSAGKRSPLLVAQDCEASGGTMVVGLAGPQCARAQPDAGKACSDNGECAGFCLAQSRSCSPVTPYFGCHEVLLKGTVAAICID